MSSGFERGVNENCALLGFYTASIDIVPCRRFGTFDCEILTAVLVKIQVIWDVSSCRMVNLPYLQGQQSKTNALRSTEPSVTLHQPTGRNLRQHLCENVMSHGIEDRAGQSYCVWRVFYGSVKTIAAFTKAPHWTYFSFRALYIKTLVNTNKCTILQSVYSFYYI